MKKKPKPKINPTAQQDIYIKLPIPFIIINY